VQAYDFVIFFSATQRHFRNALAVLVQQPARQAVMLLPMMSPSPTSQPHGAQQWYNRSPPEKSRSSTRKFGCSQRMAAATG